MSRSDIITTVDLSSLAGGRIARRFTRAMAQDAERMSDVIVIGAGPAATAAANAAKGYDAAREVILVTDEAVEPYEKPPLSKNVLLGKASPDDAPIAGSKGVAGHGVSVVRGKCVSIDRSSHTIVLQDEQRLRYGALVLATGADVRKIAALPGLLPGVHYLRTASDALRLRDEFLPGRRLLVVGGGLIGLEVAASAVSIGMSVDLIEADNALLSRSCPPAVSDYLLKRHRESGVGIHLQTIANTAHTSNSRELVVETSGRAFVADLVVVGVGAVPNVTLASEAGLSVENGICVDGHCRTTDERIFAAGDVARGPSAHGSVRLENWAHAQAQGKVAGINAAGGNQAYEPLLSFWTEQYDLYVQGVGWLSPEAELVRRQSAEKSWMLFGLRDGRVAFAFGVNAQRDMAVARRLIERKVPVSADALVDGANQLQALLKLQPVQAS